MSPRASRRGSAVAALPANAGASLAKKSRARPSRSPWPLVTLFALVCCCGALFTTEMLLSLSSAPADETVATNPPIVVSDGLAAVPGLDEQAISSVENAPALGVPVVIPSAKDQPRGGECFSFRDYGLVGELRASAKSFCSPPRALGSGAWQTTYSFLRSEGGGMQATVFRDLRLDLSRAQVARDIRDLSQDGGDHDPRFLFDSVRPLCACAEDAPRQDMAHGAPRVWHSMLAREPSTSRPKSKFRSAPQLLNAYQALYLVCDSSNVSRVAATPDRSFPDDVNVVLMARKDDHNPFFQVSAALNAWLMLRVLNWSADSTQLVYLDRGIPSPVDELQHKLVAPHRPALSADALFGSEGHRKTAHFGSVLLSPFETTGPLMRHLDDKEPCARSQLVQDFRAASLVAIGVDGARVSLDKTAACLVTIISRRAYGGRQVQRVWRNEDEVLARMRSDLGDRCAFQSLDFVDLSITEQMSIMVDSDVVIGMHGAGLVNVLWTRPQTLVLEIFPKLRRRWGYRNICQHVGCDWREFRGGKDVPPATTAAGKPRRPRQNDPNAFDKTIPPDDWAKFANPLIAAVAARVAPVAAT